MKFIKGVDISMIKELEAKGASYSLDGVPKDIFEILKTCGTDMIRLRLWHNPYSENGEEYGGGTNDIETTIELAKRVKANDIGFMLDIHYSDFWADPSKQIKPKAWKNMTGQELSEAVYQYTLTTLQRFRKEDLLPDMIQIGNEITNGLLWPEGHIDNVKKMTELLAEGIRGAREICPFAKIVLHLDFGTDNKMYRNWFQKVEPYHLDFDIVGMSYYPHWNGSLEKLLYNMNDISQLLQKDVLVAETSIGYTTDTLGCKGIVFSRELEEATDYPATMEGQEQFLRDLITTVRQVKEDRGIGVFYWEPAWLPIPDCTWANSIGCEYMSDKVEGGNSMANQALFDKNGNANRALVHLKAM